MKISFKDSSSPLKRERLFRFINKRMKELSQSLVYSVLLMYYAFKSYDTPLFAKNVILGTIGYVLAPIDSIPDLTPLFGFTDDLGVLSFGLVSIACYINDKVRKNALDRMHKIYKNVDTAAVQKIDAKL